MEKRVCNVCNLEKPYGDFPAGESPKYISKVGAACKACRSKKSVISAMKKPDYHEVKRLASQKSYTKRKILEPEKLMAKEARKRSRGETLPDGSPLPFSITWKDIYIPKTCPLIGIDLQFAYGQAYAAKNSPSLDRIYPEKGYVPGNIMVISNLANSMKNQGTPEQLKALARNLTDIVNNRYPFTLEEAKALSPQPYIKPKPEDIPNIKVKRTETLAAGEEGEEDSGAEEMVGEAAQHTTTSTTHQIQDTQQDTWAAPEMEVPHNITNSIESI